MCRFNAHWSSKSRKNITNSVTQLVTIYRQLGVLIFSTEPDGMLHLDYEQVLAKRSKLRESAVSSHAQIAASVKKARNQRQKANQDFASYVNRDLTDSFWKAQSFSSIFGRADDDIFVKILLGIAGIKKVKIVTSRLNNGAISNLPNDVVCEYSQYLYKDKVEPVACHQIPKIVHGIISSLATHQTMLADACATEDPKLLAQALLAYPVRPYSKAARDLYRKLIVINREEIVPSLRTADNYL